MHEPIERTDVLVIGSGIAGLRSALALADRLQVCVLTKKKISESNTNYAQGGIASVLAEDDSFELHVRDTLQAGAGLCHEDTVRRVVEQGPALIADLVQQGIEFDEATPGAYELGREGGHSRRRIVHAGDFTGRQLEAALVRRTRRHPSIRMYEHHLVVDLLQEDDGRVVGALVFDHAEGTFHQVLARVTVLASGGSGKVYRYTSNPDIATGDGLAMAYRAGARVANLEFFQFHPTCLYHPKAKNFLISEAVRGEGAVLRNLDGEAFVGRYHELADLAPRDVVARAIDQEMKERGEDYVLLDTTQIGAERCEERFPNITARCREYGMDMAREPIPVVPAAHYQCGGVVVDEHGQSDLVSLYVIGEAACTGLHGANRLASNSLLEALYFAHASVGRILETIDGAPRPGPAPPGPTTGTRRLARAALRHDWEVARRTMWDYVGIVRDSARLEVAQHRLDAMAEDAETWMHRYRPDADMLELRNVTLVGSLLTIRCARFRKESRGLHTMPEHPESDDAFLGDTHLQRGRVPWLVPAEDPRTLRERA